MCRANRMDCPANTCHSRPKKMTRTWIMDHIMATRTSDSISKFIQFRQKLIRFCFIVSHRQNSSAPASSAMVWWNSVCHSLPSPTDASVRDRNEGSFHHRITCHCLKIDQSNIQNRTQKHRQKQLTYAFGSYPSTIQIFSRTSQSDEVCVADVPRTQCIRRFSKMQTSDLIKFECQRLRLRTCDLHASNRSASMRTSSTKLEI